MMSECQTIAQIVANSIASEDGDIGDNDEHESHNSKKLAVELANLSFGEAVAALNYCRRHVAHQSDGESNAAFQIIEKHMVLTGERKKRQSTIFEYFMSLAHFAEINCLQSKHLCSHSISELSSLLCLLSCYVFPARSAEKSMNGVPLYKYICNL